MTSFPPKIRPALAGNALPGCISGSQLLASLPALCVKPLSFLALLTTPHHAQFPSCYQDSPARVPSSNPASVPLSPMSA